MNNNNEFIFQEFIPPTSNANEFYQSREENKIAELKFKAQGHSSYDTSNHDDEIIDYLDDFNYNSDKDTEF